MTTAKAVLDDREDHLEKTARVIARMRGPPKEPCKTPQNATLDDGLIVGTNTRGTRLSEAARFKRLVKRVPLAPQAPKPQTVKQQLNEATEATFVGPFAHPSNAPDDVRNDKDKKRARTEANDGAPDGGDGSDGVDSDVEDVNWDDWDWRRNGNKQLPNPYEDVGEVSYEPPAWMPDALNHVLRTGAQPPAPPVVPPVAAEPPMSGPPPVPPPVPTAAPTAAPTPAPTTSAPSISAAPTATFAPTPAPLKTPVELVIPGTAAASNATPAVLNVTCLCDVEENKTVTCPDNSTQHFWCNGMPGEHSLVCGSTTSGCATWDTTRGRYVVPDYCEKVAGDDGETTCLCDLELGAAADFSTADGATDAMAAFKSIMGAPIDLSKALMMIIILLSILVFHTGWSVVGGAQDRCDEKAEADAALVATSAFDVDADLPVGQGAAAALARRTEAIFTRQSWGHWWDVMCAEHPILNIVFVHDDTPRFVRIWAFAFEVLCGLWGMALEVMLSYPEPDPECASYTAQWEACDYCPEAIVGGVCYPEKIGQLGTVVQDQGDGTFAEVETTICPKAWKAARTACEDDGIKTRTIVGNKLCLWNRCAEECCDFYAGGCPDDPPDDSASPEHYMCLILVMIVFIPIVMIFEWAMDAYLTQPLPEALEPYLGGFCRGCAWICGQSAADAAAAADADAAPATAPATAEIDDPSFRSPMCQSGMSTTRTSCGGNSKGT